MTTAGGGGFSNTATNLFDTVTGNRIFLYTDGPSGLVVARVGTGAGVGDFNSAGAISFALSLEDNGTVSIAQYRAIEHPTTTQRDESVTLSTPAGTGLVFATVLVVDGDGDPVSKTSNALTIKFDDDGPTAVLSFSTATIVYDERPPELTWAPMTLTPS